MIVLFFKILLEDYKYHTFSFSLDELLPLVPTFL